ncbi:MAG: GNAT family N-acetyltransferase [Gemmatimonadaceae bacterium]
MSQTSSVFHNPSAGLFELRTESGTASLRYAYRGADLDLIHTEVPDSEEGQGYGSALAKAALEYAQSERVTVVPSCPFVRRYIESHPEYAGLVAQG